MEVLLGAEVAHLLEEGHQVVVVHVVILGGIRAAHALAVEDPAEADQMADVHQAVAVHVVPADPEIQKVVHPVPIIGKILTGLLAMIATTLL